VVALGLAGFAVAFGTRHADATEHQDGLMMAISLESVVKLTAFLSVGAYIVFWMFDGPADIAARVVEKGLSPDLLASTSGVGSFLVLILLAACASILMPRQFHMGVVENRAVEDVKRAAWLFPAYLVLTTLFVAPMALAGLAVFPEGTIDRDMTVLALPLREGASSIAVLAFIGGFSAATAMVIVESIAVAIMVSNHLVVPLVLRRRPFSGGGPPPGERLPTDLSGVVLEVRRVAIVSVILLAYAYHRISGEAALAALGLLSFAAIAQIAPAFIGGLFWGRGTALGAIVGLSVGILSWGYTLVIPSLSAAGVNLGDLLIAGPFGIEALKPTALLGTDLPQLTHGVVWSLSLNALAYMGFSLLKPANALERLQANAFVGEPDLSIAPTFRLLRANVTVEDVRSTVARYLGVERTQSSFEAFARSRAQTLDLRAHADIHLLRYAEHLLASAIGAASSRLALSLLLRRRNVSTEAALKLLDDVSAAIQYSRDVLQHAIDHARQGITVLDRDLQLVAWNRAFVRLYQLPPEMVRVGIGLEEVIRFNAERGSYGPGPVDDVVSARLHTFVHDLEPTRLRVQGSGTVVEVRTNQLPDGGFVTTYTDVTETVAAEEARERANEILEQRVRERTEELTRLNQELRGAKAEAEEANISKTRFLAAASHDILQPLNAARLYASSLVERDRDKGDPALAHNVDASLEAVEEILTALLDISRLDAGALKPQWSVFRIDELFRQLELEFQPSARASGLKLQIVRSTAVVRSDRRLLRRLLQNLISNALKYTPCGRVLVGVRRRGQKAVFEVWDTGLGIPESKQQLVFREFQRLDAGTKVARGLGLGLSIVQRIGKVLDTPVTLSSSPGHGTVFRVELPVVEASLAEVVLQPEVRTPTTPLSGLRVLVIDNEPAILDSMRLLLQGWGCVVATATDRDEALAAAPR
jgi:signal transduction histidine kinase/Na+/proline symporter